MKNKMKTLIVASAALSLTGLVQAEDLTVSKKTSKKDDYSISAADYKATPELLDQAKISMAASSSPKMKCLVDTPAWDLWGSPFCFSAGFARSTTAYFQIDNMPSNYTVNWSDSRCSSTSRTCALPIRTYQSISLSATVLNHGNNTFTQTSSTAEYEGMN
ncbi:MAG: hypothetical protein OQK04_05765 [Kangiellaceae bacterium]|nr:hypothetical protein [Kangiellaceae bacterium]MCW8998202.1 hypothetical protein [Kangiellaceae bacterium]